MTQATPEARRQGCILLAMARVIGAVLAAAVYWLADQAMTSLVVILFVLALFIAGIVAWAARVAIVGKLVIEELDFTAVKIFGFLR
ncbi:MAG TPA: hypothetical protein VLM18_11235 [Croceibacterium sp.]|nr:hypothetical protein [Croceibacterium sp.]